MVGGVVETVTPWYEVGPEDPPAPLKVLVCGMNGDSGQWRVVVLAENPGILPGDQIWWDRKTAFWTGSGNPDHHIERAHPRSAWDPFKATRETEKEAQEFSRKNSPRRG